MMELATLAAVRAALVASAAVVALVPARAIRDHAPLPAPLPSILIGAGDLVDANAVARGRWTVTHTLHLWLKEDGTAGARALAGAIREAVSRRLELGPGLHCVDCRVSFARFLRDGPGVSHGVVTVELVVRTA